ncbi:MAG: TonB-dependent receptor, partial [Cyclobacteriaceae bacterium]|nr:TonB-dependent receptor [Cyclobacteriaceae bacterium]
NLIATTQAGKKWGTTLLLHGSNRPFEMDQNKDGFLDFPLGQQVNLINRWVYNSGTGWLGQLSFKYLKDEKIGGQKGYPANKNSTTLPLYGLEINTERREVTGKLGYQFAGKPYKSFGIQLDAFDHMHRSHFSKTNHDATERSLYTNLIYQSIIGSTQHKWKAGASVLVDDYQEEINAIASWPFSDSLVYSKQQVNRHEVVPGAFAEYSYDDLKKFSVIAGLRVDHHNLFGTFVVPRLNLKYNLTSTTTLRASAGRGIRVANIFIENPGFLASSRTMVRELQLVNKAYGFQPDKAWNYGANVSQEFTLNYQPGTLSVDYYFTNFESQVVADYDFSARQVLFHGLNGGKSFSHSLQVQLDYQPVRRLDVRLAWRHANVQTDYRTGRLQRPLVARDRAFLNVAFATKNNWRLDYTVQWMGPQRLPSTKDNPVALQLSSWSDAYVLMNAQISKDFGARWSAYVGAENLGNFMVKNPIVAANDPFGPYFDTSMVWGPVFGRMWYGGFRYRIK